MGLRGRLSDFAENTRAAFGKSEGPDITTLQRHGDELPVRENKDYVTTLNIDGRQHNHEKSGSLPEFRSNVVNPVAGRISRTLDKWTDKLAVTRIPKNLGKKAYGHSENFFRWLFDVKKMESEAEEKIRVGKELEKMNSQLAEIKAAEKAKRDKDVRNALHEYAYGMTADEAEKTQQEKGIEDYLSMPTVEQTKSEAEAEQAKIKKDAEEAGSAAKAKQEKKKVVEMKWTERGSEMDFKIADVFRKHKPFSQNKENETLISALEHGTLTLPQAHSVMRGLEKISYKLKEAGKTDSTLKKELTQINKLKKQLESVYPSEEVEINQAA